MHTVRMAEMTPQIVSSLVQPVLARFPVERAWLYGSVARGDQHQRSDIDLIVELQEGARMGLDFMDIETELARAFRHPVDVRTLQRSRSTKAFLSNFDHEKVLVYERAPR